MLALSCPGPRPNALPWGPGALVGRGAAQDRITRPSLSPFFGLVFLLMYKRNAPFSSACSETPGEKKKRRSAEHFVVSLGLRTPAELALLSMLQSLSRVTRGHECADSGGDGGPPPPPPPPRLVLFRRLLGIGVAFDCKLCDIATAALGCLAEKADAVVERQAADGSSASFVSAEALHDGARNCFLKKNTLSWHAVGERRGGLDRKSEGCTGDFFADARRRVPLRDRRGSSARAPRDIGKKGAALRRCCVPAEAALPARRRG